MKNMRRLSNVRRWATIQTIQKQSVAEHSYNVTCYTMGICKAMGTPVSHVGPLLTWALAHDLEEAMTGDIPSPSKKRLNPGPFFHMKAVGEDYFWLLDNDEMDETDFDIIKLADLLDAYIFLRRETMLGNMMVDKLTDQYYQLVWGLANKIGADAENFVRLVVKQEEKQKWMA